MGCWQETMADAGPLCFGMHGQSGDVDWICPHWSGGDGHIWSVFHVGEPVVPGVYDCFFPWRPQWPKGRCNFWKFGDVEGCRRQTRVLRFQVRNTRTRCFLHGALDLRFTCQQIFQLRTRWMCLVAAGAPRWSKSGIIHPWLGGKKHWIGKTQ